MQDFYYKKLLYTPKGTLTGAFVYIIAMLCSHFFIILYTHHILYNILLTFSTLLYIFHNFYCIAQHSLSLKQISLYLFAVLPLLLYASYSKIAFHGIPKSMQFYDILDTFLLIIYNLYIYLIYRYIFFTKRKDYVLNSKSHKITY